MTDSMREVDTTAVEHPEAVHGPSTAALAASVRSLRIWLAILTSIVGIVVVLGLVVVAFWVATFAGIASEDTGTSDSQLASMKNEVTKAYGDRLESVDVRSVKIDEGAPFPYSLLAGAAGDSVYVQYKLRGSPVVVADLVGGPYGNDLSSAGMLPTQGSLTSRMTEQQLDRLLAAYANETTLPLGSVRRYGDKGVFPDGGTAPVLAEVKVGDRTYQTSELWSATQGEIVEGGSANMDESSGMRRAFIFREDPKSGQFTFLGTEPVESAW